MKNEHRGLDVQSLKGKKSTPCPPGTCPGVSAQLAALSSKGEVGLDGDSW